MDLFIRIFTNTILKKIVNKTKMSNNIELDQSILHYEIFCEIL